MSCKMQTATEIALWHLKGFSRASGGYGRTSVKCLSKCYKVDCSSLSFARKSMKENENQANVLA